MRISRTKIAFIIRCIIVGIIFIPAVIGQALITKRKANQMWGFVDRFFNKVNAKLDPWEVNTPAGTLTRLKKEYKL